MKFPLGQIVVTPKAEEVLQHWGQSADAILARHQSGDWGEVSDEQRRVNEDGLGKRFNLVSCYHTPSGQWLTVFTKADRSLTLVSISPDQRGSNSV
jgi:hypothetical protein